MEQKRKKQIPFNVSIVLKKCAKLMHVKVFKANNKVSYKSLCCVALKKKEVIQEGLKNDIKIDDNDLLFLAFIKLVITI